MKIAREFRWEMGHRLREHSGLCKNIHGHSYKMILTVEGFLNEQQMVIDYYDLDKIVKPIIQQFDHCFMINEKDSDLLEFLNQQNFKIVVVDFETTVENITRFILQKIKNANFPSNIKSVAVRVYETETDYAEENILLN